MIASSRLLTVLRVAAAEMGGRYYPDYSGKWMFGAECIGIVGPSDHIIASTVMSVACRKRVAKEAAAFLRRCKRDDMGLGAILYAPNWVVSEPTEVS